MHEQMHSWNAAQPSQRPNLAPAAAIPRMQAPAQERRLDKFLARGMQIEASDVHIQPNQPVWYSVNGETKIDVGFAAPLTPADCDQLLSEIISERRGRWEQFQNRKRLDFSYELGHQRFRGHYGIAGRSSYGVFRLLNSKIPEFSTLTLPNSVRDLTNLSSGLIIFAGVTGSGKSTSSASLENIIVQNKHKKIITIEEPIEYRHLSAKSLVIQREVGEDVDSFLLGIEDAMREAPDIIKVGEMRDPETMLAAIRAATTGHLVFATIHAESARDVPTRILDTMPGDKLNDVRAQLSRSLKAVVYQRLLPSVGGGRRVLGYEIMHMTPQIANHIKTNKLESIDDELVVRDTGNVLYEQCLAELVQKGRITTDTARNHAIRPKQLERYLGTALR